MGTKISLPAGSAWLIQGNVDLTGDWLDCDTGAVAIGGTSSETASLTSTGITGGQALIRARNSLVLSNLTITSVAEVFDIDGSAYPFAALDWRATNFISCGLGTIKDVSNFVYTLGAWLSSGGLELDGTIGTVSISNSLVSPGAGQTAITLLSSAVISRRFRSVLSAWSIDTGETGIAIADRAATFSIAQSLQLYDISFSGTGTYITGADELDNETDFRTCQGIANSAEVGHYAIVGNTTETVITSSGTKVKVAGTSADGAEVAKFDQTGDNTAKYTGSLTQLFRVSVSGVLTSGNNKDIEIQIYAGNPLAADAFSVVSLKTNASGRVENFALFSAVSLSTNDMVEVWVSNETDTTNITVTNMQVLITPA